MMRSEKKTLTHNKAFLTFVSKNFSMGPMITRAHTHTYTHTNVEYLWGPDISLLNGSNLELPWSPSNTEISVSLFKRDVESSNYVLVQCV